MEIAQEEGGSAVLLGSLAGRRTEPVRPQMIAGVNGPEPTNLQTHRLEGKCLLSSDHVWRIEALIFDGPNSSKERGAVRSE